MRELIERCRRYASTVLTADEWEAVISGKYDELAAIVRERRLTYYEANHDPGDEDRG